MSRSYQAEAAEKITQFFMGKINQLYNAFPSDADPFFLAAMRCFHDAVLPTLTQDARRTYEALTSESETAAILLREVNDDG